MSELFSFSKTSATDALSELNPTPLFNYGLPVLDNTRIEYYNNGPYVRAPRTQYSLVLDINRSQYRYTISFLTNNSGYTLFRYQYDHSFYSQKDEKRQAKRALDRFEDLDLHKYDAFMHFGRWNPTPGKKKPDLIPELKVWGFLITNPEPTEAGPLVLLHWGDQSYMLEPKDWISPTGRPHHACKWQAFLDHTHIYTK